MIQYEYLVVNDRNYDLQTLLNDAGNAGWKLLHIVPAAYGTGSEDSAEFRIVTAVLGRAKRSAPIPDDVDDPDEPAF